MKPRNPLPALGSLFRRVTASLSSHENACVFGLTVLAAVVRLYRIDAVTLWGDEYASVREAMNLGTNLNSLPYFIFLRIWIKLFGYSETALRLPAAIFGTLTVPIFYLMGRELLHRRVAFFSAFLLALSAYAIASSQIVRYYSLFLFSATLCFLLFVRALKHHTGWLEKAAFVLSHVLCILSFALGFLVPLIEIVTLYLGSAKQSRWALLRRALLLIVVCALLLGVLSLPEVRQWGFALIARLTAARETRYLSARGLSLVNLGKVILTFFLFTFGENVYPGNLPLVCLPSILCCYLLLRGFWSLRSNRLAFVLVSTSFVTSLSLLYLVFDSLIPSTYEGAQPQFIIFLLPLYDLVLAHSVVQERGWKQALTGGALVALSVVVLWQYWSPGWSYRVPLTDWRWAARYVQQSADDSTVLLYDGRSADPIQYYFPSSIASRGFWNYTGGDQGLGDLHAFDRLIFISNDSQDGNRAVMSAFLQRLETQFAFQDGFVEYPLFVYVYLRNDTGGYHVDEATGIISIPKEIYGLPFSDLRLPQEARYAGLSIPLTGSFSLPSLDGSRDRTIPLRGNVSGEALVLLSNLTQARSLPFGEPVAEVIVYPGEGEPVHFVLRKGIETNDWSEGCGPEGSSPSTCEIAFSWHKRIAMVGRRAYEGAWRDFQAHIFGTTLALDAPVALRAIGIHYLAGKGTLHVWGMAVVRK
jgi:hypothetical protein